MWLMLWWICRFIPTRRVLISDPPAVTWPVIFSLVKQSCNYVGKFRYGLRGRRGHFEIGQTATRIKSWIWLRLLAQSMKCFFPCIKRNTEVIFSDWFSLVSRTDYPEDIWNTGRAGTNKFWRECRGSGPFMHMVIELICINIFLLFACRHTT